MPPKRPLRLLASASNERGDLFTRLNSDLFFALGYDNLRFNIHKTGREIDIEGTHRHEPRRLVAECKAHAKAMGGDDFNKILGAVTRERDKGQPVTGYFVSLGGFTESAIEQELNSGEQIRIIPITAHQVIEELIKSHILISKEDAIERAGRCAEYARLGTDTNLSCAELLGHSLGYIWAIYYERGKELTHVALIHADGSPLAESAAAEVIAADRKGGGSIHKLVYLAPPRATPDRQARAAEAMNHYRTWLAKVCGYIQLDGLPAEGTIASKQMILENLFVPLKLQVQSEKREKDDSSLASEVVVDSVGNFLAEHNRISILAKPGGGKSTLLKRLAVAYADPDRRGQSNDSLPERDWLPLFLRCRDLRSRAGEPIRELLCDLGRYAEMDATHVAEFREIVDEALNAGRVLLLVDGLDEFSDTAARTTFADHLRTFLGMYPHTALVLTSREAGFRQVAGVIASVCESTTMAPFDEEDVKTLCGRWHAEVLPDTQENRNEAAKLALTIWENDRIRVLAENPLMLTTLLVVKRNVGELPTKRVKLYAAAISVLIRTWNVEGFAPLNEEETLARLSYIAVAMMWERKQRIGRRQLQRLLREAQTELEAELAYAEITPNDFIERVEYRSSLLMQTGHEEIDGELEEIYEFRHLTFQEYLAARGLVEEQYPGRDNGIELAKLVEPYFQDEAWREVIPLAAVLANRKAEPLIRTLTELCAALPTTESPETRHYFDPHVVLLRRCILDEILVKESLLRSALQQLARHGNESHAVGSAIEIRRGKFGEAFQAIAENAFFNDIKNWEQYQGVIMDLGVEQFFGTIGAVMSSDIAVELESTLKSGDRVQQGLATTAVAYSAYARRYKRHEDWTSLSKLYSPLRSQIGDLLRTDDAPVVLCAAWAFAWTGESGLPDTPPDKDAVVKLFRLWQDASSSEVRRYACWALACQPLLARDAIAASSWGDCDEVFHRRPLDYTEEDAVLVLAWYRRSPWSDEQLLSKLEMLLRTKGSFDVEIDRRPAVLRLLNEFGTEGRELLNEYKQRVTEPNFLSWYARRLLELED